ncbi:MAG: peroxiredoxin family protein, partial [Planctomycetota bacterium]
MFEINKQTGISLAVVFTIVIIAAVMGTGCKKQPAEQIRTGHNFAESTQSEALTENTGESGNPDIEPTDPPQPEPPVENPNTPPENNPTKTDTNPAIVPKLNLNEIIKARKDWDPYIPWYGKLAPDFTLTDIAGKNHKLSDYRGRNVLIVFWATWCPPCQMMVPHLIELRKTLGEDNLAMLGISYITSYPPNTAEMIKMFTEIKKTNYTVFAAD